MRLGCVLKQVLFPHDVQGCGECTHLVVGGVHHDHGEEALGQGLVEELEEAGTVVGLHRIIVFILLHLLGERMKRRDFTAGYRLFLQTLASYRVLPPPPPPPPPTCPYLVGFI